MKLPVVPAKTNAPAATAGVCGTGATPMVSSEVVPAKDYAGNVLMVTLGCAKNLVDSEVMLGALRSRGFQPIAEPNEADLIVVNTCAFLQSAVEEGIDRILEMSEYKASGRCRKLVVAGCMVERYRDELKKSLPEVDQFLSTDELLKVGSDDATSEECFQSARRPYFLYDESMPRIRSTAGHTSYIKVAEGCNRPCTFCIIPKIRGSFRSRSIESIRSEADRLLDQGVRELNLVAQDLTAFGTDFE
ncbi:MAG: radical SAM protein, partial [Bdellovibrionales bacterium]|nr:radical SAM protein [Bdellovibrionales bacterium]